MIISENKLTPPSEWPGTKSIDMLTPECMQMLWELTMDISNRLAKLENHVNQYFLLSGPCNPNSWSEDDNL